MPNEHEPVTIADIDAMLDGELSKRLIQAFRELNVNAKDERTDRKKAQSISVTISADVQSDDRSLIEYGVFVSTKLQPVKKYKKGFSVNVRENGDISIAAHSGPIDGQLDMEGAEHRRSKLVLHKEVKNG